MKPLISIHNPDKVNSKERIKRCVKVLKGAGIYCETGKDDPHHPEDFLISVKEEDYPQAMKTLYPNRDNSKIGSVVFP